MANIPMQTIKYPGLPDTYTFVQIGTEAGQAADAKATNDAIQKAFATDTASGSIASFPDGADGIPMKDVLVNIEPAQAGTGDPSPTNVRAISGWDAVKVTRAGKNLLFNQHTDSPTVNGVTFTLMDDGSIDLDGTATKNTEYYISSRVGANAVTLSEGEYILSGIPTGYSSVDLRIGYNRGADGTTIGADKGRGVVINDPGGFLPYGFWIAFMSGATFNHVRVYPMIRRATDSDTYEPYAGDTFPITLPAEAGTVYGGILDVTSGVLTVTDAQIASYAGETLPGEWISDRDVYVAGTTPTTGAQVVYKLATPITYQLTPQEITSLLGTNNVWADTGDSTVEYRANTKLWVQKKITEAVSALS